MQYCLTSCSFKANVTSSVRERERGGGEVQLQLDIFAQVIDSAHEPRYFLCALSDLNSPYFIFLSRSCKPPKNLRMSRCIKRWF